MGMFRKCIRDVTLSDGTFLPKGAYVGINTQDAMFNHSTLADPYEFDGLGTSQSSSHLSTSA